MLHHRKRRSENTKTTRVKCVYNFNKHTRIRTERTKATTAASVQRGKAPKMTQRRERWTEAVTKAKVKGGAYMFKTSVL